MASGDDADRDWGAPEGDWDASGVLDGGGAPAPGDSGADPEREGPRGKDAEVKAYLSAAKRKLQPRPASLTARQRLWLLLDDPGSSPAARGLAMSVMLLIAVSCVTFCLETLPQFRDEDQAVWDGIELLCIAFFTLEFVLRLGCCPDVVEFAKGWLNLVDVMAILPFYVELAVSDGGGSGSSAVFRIVRLIRVFRVLKVGRYMSWLRIFTNAMVLSAQPLGMLGFVMAIGLVVFSSAMYYAERGSFDDARGEYVRDDGSASPFHSIPAAFWWAIVTMTTVGYGDDVPVTFAGKIIATATSLCGILVLAVPITVISANFNQEYDQVRQAKEIHRDRMAMLRAHVKGNVTGLEALQDEVAFIVKKSYDEFQVDVERMVNDSRRELSDEIQSLVKVTHDNMQRERTRRLQHQHPHPPKGPSNAG